MKRLRPATAVAIAILAASVALPAMAAKPSSPPGQEKARAAKVEKVEVTLVGTIEIPASADGTKVYTLTDGGTTYTLEAGPHWFFGDTYPLDPYVGLTVTVVGEKADGSSEVDVISIDGVPLREPGKPPWAGGWKVVGERHPGWSQEKADRFQEKFGDCFPPGRCKDKGDKPAKPNAGGADGEEPDTQEPEEPAETDVPQTTQGPEATDGPASSEEPEPTEATVPSDGITPTDAPASEAPESAAAG